MCIRSVDLISNCLLFFSLPFGLRWRIAAHSLHPPTALTRFIFALRSSRPFIIMAKFYPHWTHSFHTITNTGLFWGRGQTQLANEGINWSWAAAFVAGGEHHCVINSSPCETYSATLVVWQFSREAYQRCKQRENRKDCWRRVPGLLTYPSLLDEKFWF